MSEDEREELKARIDGVLTVALMAIELTGKNLPALEELDRLLTTGRQMNWPAGSIDVLKTAQHILKRPPDA